MNLVFFYIGFGEELRLAEIMIESGKRTNPNIRVVQLTDMETPSVAGVDYCLRFMIQKPLMQARLILWRKFIENHSNNDATLLVDPDLVIQKDLTYIFSMDFDVGLTYRTNPRVINNRRLYFNGGVIFAKPSLHSINFFRTIEEAISVMTEDHRNWFGDELALLDFV